MADTLRLIELSPGGRQVQVLDLQDGDGYKHKRDTFQVTPPPSKPRQSAHAQRYGGGRVVGEAHDNAQLGWTSLVRGTSVPQALGRIGDLLEALEDAGIERWIEWRISSAPYPVLFEVRGPATWVPHYAFGQFDQAHSIEVDITVPVSPIAYGLSMDIWDPFDVDSDADYTTLVGAGLTATAGVGMVATAGALRFIHDARGYNYIDPAVWCGIAVPTASFGAQLFAPMVKYVDANNWLTCTINGANVEFQVRVAGVTTTTTAAHGLTAETGRTYFLRAQQTGSIVTVSVFDVAPSAALTTTPLFNTLFALTPAQALVLGGGVAGKCGYNGTWAAGALMVDFGVEAFSIRSFITNGAAQNLNQSIPGTAPPRVRATITRSATTSQAFGLIAWGKAQRAHNWIWNGDFEANSTLAVQGWSTAVVANILPNGSASALALNASAKRGHQSGSFTLPAAANNGVAFRMAGDCQYQHTYTARMWVRLLSGAATVKLRLGTSSPSDFADSAPLVLTTAWQMIEVQWTTANAGVPEAIPVYAALVATSATAASVAYDEAEVYEGLLTQPPVYAAARGKGGRPVIGGFYAMGALPDPSIYLLNWTEQAPTFTGAVLTGERCLRDGSNSGVESYHASWLVDPSRTDPDEFSDFIQVDVYAYLAMSSTVKAYASASIQPYLSTAYEQFGEFGSAGRLLVAPSALRARWYRLGTLTYETGPGAQRKLLHVKLATVAGSSGVIELVKVIQVPTQRRASTPTGKTLDAAYPLFLPSGGQGEERIVNHDLSTSWRVPGERLGVADISLSGSVIAPPAGPAMWQDLVSVMPVDDTVPSSTTDVDAQVGTRQLSVMPGYHLLRDG